MNKATERFYKAVGRHFVTLSCVQTPPGGTELVHVISGFVVDIKGTWVYVTAGHILRRIEVSLKAGGKFGVWRLGDHSAGKAQEMKHSGIPFDFNMDEWLVIEDEEIGLDYAVVVLTDWYRRQLEVGGVVPLSRVTWGDHVSEHDQWALVGVPSETVEYTDNTFINAKVVVIPLEQTEEPKGAGAKAKNQFYGRLKEDSASTVKDIDGMSGGPIFAINKVAEKTKYWVIGVQSAWYRDARVIAACPFSSLGEAIEEAVDEELARRNCKRPGSHLFETL